VLQFELQRVLAIEFVGHQGVDGVDAVGQRVSVEEAHGSNVSPWRASFNFRCFSPTTRCAMTSKVAVNNGRENLVPIRVVELLGELVAVVGGIEFAVGFDRAFQIGRVDQFAHHRLERLAEFVVTAGGRLSPRHGVAGRI